MPTVRLPDEELPHSPGKFVKTFYSTKPFDVGGFTKEVGGLDAIILRQGGFLEGLRQLQSGEEVTVGDVVLINPNHDLHPEATAAKRPRKNYAVVAEVNGGYKIRELAGTLIFEHDVPELFTKR
ncbi:hypothetical protein HYV85_04910 [Candidatus Woesearchaeota archaeon]|nr:hypothetical protein [Candidatus Woesearchaeota archaeon]